MKTTFKKTLAAVAAAAVVAASAAVMTMPASAAGSITIGTVEMTLSELQAANYQVAVPVTASAEVSTLAMGVTLDDGLTFVEGTSNGGLAAAPANGQFVWYSMLGMSPVPADCGTIVVTVESSATAGSTYSLTASKTNSDGEVAVDLNNDADVALTSGAIVITADPTEPPTATPVTETDAPTEAPSKATQTTKPKTDSPKTGDALPIAGVAVAVAVIGGVALVSKKRK